MLVEFAINTPLKMEYFAVKEHDAKVKGTMRFIVPCIYKQSPYALVITAEVFSDHIAFDKTPATIYELYNRQIKTARPDQADLKSSGLGEKSPINYTLLEILGECQGPVRDSLCCGWAFKLLSPE